MATGFDFNEVDIVKQAENSTIGEIDANLAFYQKLKELKSLEGKDGKILFEYNSLPLSGMKQHNEFNDSCIKNFSQIENLLEQELIQFNEFSLLILDKVNSLTEVKDYKEFVSQHNSSITKEGLNSFDKRMFYLLSNLSQTRNILNLVFDSLNSMI